jgi:hypothetical protein
MFHLNLIEFSLFTTTFNSFTDEIFCRYLLYHSISVYFIDGFTNEIWSLKKTSSVISGLSASLLVKKNPMVLQTNNARKKITCWNISTKLFRRWLAVAFGVILFQLSVKYNNEREIWNEIKYPDR